MNSIGGFDAGHSEFVERVSVHGPECRAGSGEAGLIASARGTCCREGARAAIRRDSRISSAELRTYEAAWKLADEMKKETR